MYALYDLYGFSKDDIAVLFVAGFGSSMIFGTFIGSLADTMVAPEHVAFRPFSPHMRVCDLIGSEKVLHSVLHNLHCFLHDKAL